MEKDQLIIPSLQILQARSDLLTSDPRESYYSLTPRIQSFHSDTDTGCTQSQSASPDVFPLALQVPYARYSSIFLRRPSCQVWLQVSHWKVSVILLEGPEPA